MTLTPEQQTQYLMELLNALQSSLSTAPDKKAAQPTIDALKAQTATVDDPAFAKRIEDLVASLVKARFGDSSPVAKFFLPVVHPFASIAVSMWNAFSGRILAALTAAVVAGGVGTKLLPSNWTQSSDVKTTVDALGAFRDAHMEDGKLHLTDAQKKALRDAAEQSPQLKATLEQLLETLNTPPPTAAPPSSGDPKTKPAAESKKPAAESK